MGDEAAPPTLVGNRRVLAGAIFYLLEWVAIIGAGMVDVNETATVGTSPQDLLDSYSGHVAAVAFMAGWFAIALLGRVLVFVGLRSALADSGRSHPPMDCAVVTPAVSVTLEVAAYGVATAERDLAPLQRIWLTWKTRPRWSSVDSAGGTSSVDRRARVLAGADLDVEHSSGIDEHGWRLCPGVLC